MYCRYSIRFRSTAAAALSILVASGGSALAQNSGWRQWSEPREAPPPVERPDTYSGRDTYPNTYGNDRRYSPRDGYADDDVDGNYEFRRFSNRRYQDWDRRVWRDEDSNPRPQAQQTVKPIGSDGGGRPNIEPKAPPVVAFKAGYAPGSIVIDTNARKLYYIRNVVSAFAYPIGVGREGFAWAGSEKVSRISDWPDWYPPEEMRKRRPELPERMLGGIRNPLGAKAIYLGNTLYRIHGTNEPKSIGKAESSGCFRMLNENVLHLASLVSPGTQVTVVKSLGIGAVAAATPAEPPKPKAAPAAAQPRPRWQDERPHRWSRYNAPPAWYRPQRPLRPFDDDERRWTYYDRRHSYWRYRRDWDFPDDTR